MHKTQPRSTLRSATPLVMVFAAVVVWWIVLADGVAALLNTTEYTRGAHIVRAVGATVFVVALIAVALRGPIRRRWSDIGLRPPAEGLRQFVLGATYWLVPATVAVVVAVAVGATSFTVEAPAFEVVGMVLGLTVLVLLFEAIPEELVFRGFFYTALTDRWSPVRSVCGQAVLFTGWAVLIGAAVSAERIVMFTVFAVLLGALRAVTGSLWTSMGFHTAFQVAAQLLTGNHWPRIEIADPDGAIAALTFVAVPFTTTALLLWWCARVQRDR